MPRAPDVVATHRLHTTSRQDVLTVIATIKAGHVDGLKRILDQIQGEVAVGKPHGQDAIVPFADLSSVHFARWVILPGARLHKGTQNEKELRPSLAFSTSYDGPLSAHLAELVLVAGAGLDRVYAHCEGYPAFGSAAPASVVTFLRDHTVRAAAFHNGHHATAAQQIHAENYLRAAIQAHLESKGDGFPGKDAGVRGLVQDVQDYVSRDPSLHWAATPSPELPAWRRMLRRGLRIAVLSVGLFAVGIVTRIVGVLIRPYERREKAEDRTIDRRAAVVPRKDLGGRQHELTHLVPLKPVRFRRYALKGFLWTLNVVARYGFNNGDLMGVRSIHSAHWTLVDGDTRLLFMSNYDGSWDSYLTDFIQVERAADGMNAIWSHTEKFPPTHGLIGNGVHDQTFKAWARSYQLLAQVWYAAYPRLSVQNVHNNAEIRNGLWGHLSTAQRRSWVKRLPPTKGRAHAGR